VVVEEETYVEEETGLVVGHAGAQVLLGQRVGAPLPHLDAPTFGIEAAGTPFGNLPAPVGMSRASIMEEAFRRAQEASYTAGYWTAIYQMHAFQQVCYLFVRSGYGIDLFSFFFFP